MSTTDAATATEHDEHHESSPKQYFQIFVVLFVLTAMEIGASFIDIGPAFLPTMIFLMGLKFLLVASRFMHLRYDTVLYTQVIYTGLGLAMVLYAIVLLVFSGAVYA